MTAFLVRLGVLAAVGWALTELGYAAVVRGRLSPGELRRWTHRWLALALVLAAFPPVFERRDFTIPSLQVWTAPSSRQAPAAPVLGVPTPAGVRFVDFDRARALFLLLVAAAAALRLFRLGRDGWRLRGLLAGAVPLRTVGRVRLHAGGEAALSFRTPLRAHVLFPPALAGRPERLLTVLRHELQHHRQGDTLWVFVVEFLRVACGWNPLAHLWAARIARLHELACDEALIGRGVPSLAYGRCLLEAAETALDRRAIPAGTTGMAHSTSGAFLKRRVLMLFHYGNQVRSPWAGRVLGLMALALCLGAAAGTGDWVRDRRITLSQAGQWVPRETGGFPLVVNERVLEQLNRFLGTPDGREFFRNAIRRMESHQPMLDDKLALYGIPRDALAIGLVESGYKNHLPAVNPLKAAGVWQIMPRTAMNYALRVDDEADERLDVAKATDAAFRYLGALHLRFRDWGLAVLSYNAGENLVQRGIDGTGSRDVWRLMDAGFEGDEHYVARVIAAALILRNPSALD